MSHWQTLPVILPGLRKVMILQITHLSTGIIPESVTRTDLIPVEANLKLQQLTLLPIIPSRLITQTNRILAKHITLHQRLRMAGRGPEPTLALSVSRNMKSKAEIPMKMLLSPRIPMQRTLTIRKMATQRLSNTHHPQ